MPSVGLPGRKNRGAGASSDDDGGDGVDRGGGGKRRTSITLIMNPDDTFDAELQQAGDVAGEAADEAGKKKDKGAKKKARRQMDGAGDGRAAPNGGKRRASISQSDGTFDAEYAEEAQSSGDKGDRRSKGAAWRRSPFRLQGACAACSAR